MQEEGHVPKVASTRSLSASLWAIVITMRPKQWTKNILIFTALVFDQKLLVISDLLKTIQAFVAFCLISSTVYIINDLADRHVDRYHPTKRFRPLAAGTLSPQLAVAAILIIATIGLILSFTLGMLFSIVVLSYLLLNFSYSYKLKHVVLIDVYIIASGFMLRLVAGVVSIQTTRFSPWLYVFAGFASLFIAMAKRRSEFTLSSDKSDHRPVLSDYNLQLLDQGLTMMAAIALVVYALYTFSAPNVEQNHIMMLSILPLSYTFLRYLYLVLVKGLGGSPDKLVYQDKPLLISLIVWAMIVTSVLYI